MEPKTAKMKPSLIVPCYCECLRTALLERVGGGGLISLLVFTERCFAQHFKSEMKPSIRKPTSKQGLQSQIQSQCLSAPQGLCFFSGFDWESDTLNALKVGPCEPKGLSFMSEEQREPNLDKLCRIFWIKAYVRRDPIDTAKNGVWVLGMEAIFRMVVSFE